MTVAGEHVFHVTSLGLLSHNNNPCAHVTDGPKYPKKAGKIEQHHRKPKYLGGDPRGPTVPLDGSYHQEITNAIRDKFPYGRGPYENVDSILDDIYEHFPID